MRTKLYTCLWLLFIGHFSYGQISTITGTIMDSQTKETLPGVNVIVKNSNKGTVSDINGKFRIEAMATDTLLFSFVGYLTEIFAVNDRAVVDVSLKQDSRSLEEIVVVGYGEMKKSVVTGSITSVKAKDLETMPISRVEQALQGRTSGLTIAAGSGQPGSGATVRVRGITSLTAGANNPLWVVDGVVVDNLNYLNNADIESIEVLKDASAQAIYGARAAAGVILVTTKKGKAGKINVTYNGFYGTSAPARRLDMLNANEYATIRNESLLAGGNPARFSDPTAFGEGTDWQSHIFNNDARRQNHELSISGGNDKSTFYTSIGHWDQEGIVASDISRYTRTSFRINSTHKLSKWLTMGQNLGYAREKNLGIDVNSAFGGPLSSAINLDPITPLVETNIYRLSQSPYNRSDIFKNSYGYPYAFSDHVAQEMSHPLSFVETRQGNYGWSDNVVGNIFVEAKPIEGLTLRSTLGTKVAYWGNESFTPLSYLNSNSIVIQNSKHRSFNNRFDWNLENTVAYSKSLEQHSFTVLLGQGAYMDSRSRNINVTYYNLPVSSWKDASMNYGVPQDDRVSGGGEEPDHTVSSLFARLNYNFSEKYLLTAVLRRDGSSRFGGNNKYGFFPSASAGWVMSQENFWPANNVVQFMKFRGSYGVVGNDNIGNFSYLSTIGGGRNYAFGRDGAYINGFSPNAPANPDLRWEQTAQLNVGFESTLFNNVSLTVDWYKKVTTDLLMNPRIPAYVGAIAYPAANVGSMENTGLEVEMGYRTRVGDLNLGFNGNFSTLKNTITDLGDLDFIAGGATFHTMRGPITRTAVGQSYNSWFGYKRLGIFQTHEEVANHVNGEGQMLQPNARPGDIIWADVTGDGEINEDDRIFLGSPYPSLVFGLTVSAEYKGFDLMIFGQGVSGNMIFQGLRRLDVPNANYQRKILDRWTGPGTSNDMPRLVEGDPNHNFSNPSDLYLERGDYFRIKTMQIGYSLPRSVIRSAGMERARIYVMAENLLTFTKYTGFDPEIGGNIMGVDNGIYPQARSFMIGVNIGF